MINDAFESVLMIDVTGMLSNMFSHASVRILLA
jgi:hypothetical protein